MSNQEKYLATIDELIELSDRVVANLKPNIHHIEQDDVDKNQLVAGTKQLIEGMYGASSSMIQQINDFYRNFGYNSAQTFSGIKGILTAIKRRIEQGWLANTRNEVFAEIFSDYVDMAQYLNSRGLHIAAAVVAGVTLEERVRLLAKRHLGSDKKSDGEPQSVENLNNLLRQHYENQLTDVRIVSTYYGVRTKAAHGEWNNDSHEEKQNHISLIDVMIRATEDFINRNPA